MVEYGEAQKATDAILYGAHTDCKKCSFPWPWNKIARAVYKSSFRNQLKIGLQETQQRKLRLEKKERMGLVRLYPGSKDLIEEFKIELNFLFYSELAELCREGKCKEVTDRLEKRIEEYTELKEPPKELEQPLVIQ